MPNPTDIFGNLGWLNKWVKNLLGRVRALEIGGAGSYKVYRALLTQSGGSTEQFMSSFYDDHWPLSIGTTYKIVNNPTSGGADFTNVGAPNNNPGTYFVATGTTPNSWGVPSNPTLISYDTGAPRVIVLENTIGNIYWTYLFPGVYNADLSFLNPNDTSLIQTFTTVVTGTQNSDIASAIGFTRSAFVTVIGKLGVITSSFDLNNDIDGVLANTPIEIRVYN